MITWGDAPDTNCPCGTHPHRCRQCGPAAERAHAHDPTALIVAVLAVAGLLLLGPRAAKTEAAFEAQQLQEHQERLEVARPSAMQAVRELAADVRAGRVRAVR